MYHSIEEICTEFGIEQGTSIDDINTILTERQVRLHPDVNPDYETDPKVFEEYNHITNAKDFIKSIKRAPENLMYFESLNSLISDLHEMSVTQEKAHKSELARKEMQEAEQRLEIKCSEIVNKLISRNKPKKITSASIAAVLSTLWAAPSIIADNPFLTNYISSVSDLYMGLTVAWLMSLLIVAEVWTIAYYQERTYKRVVDRLSAEDTQYEIFRLFIDNKIQEGSIKSEENVNVIFAQNELRDFIINGYYLREHKKVMQYQRLLSADIASSIASIIIQRALDKGIIQRVEDRSWYDRYIYLTMN